MIGVILTKCEFLLSGTTRIDLDTEVKFNIASARVDGAELVRFILERTGDDKADQKLMASLTKLLRTLVKSNGIQFFITGAEVASQRLEAEFLVNKYNDYMLADNEKYMYAYIKM